MPDPLTDAAEPASEPATEPVAQPAPVRHRLRRILLGVAAGFLFLLVMVLIGGFLAFRHLDNNIGALRPDLGTQRPERVVVDSPEQPVNLLLIGSDSRVGQAGDIGGNGGDLSDTVILIHLSGGRDRIEAVSIPRDLMVDRPACKSKSGSSTVPATGPVMFNTAYGVGREGCTIRTVEAMTGIRIDHFGVLTFDGVKAVANAIGGVPVNVTETMTDSGGRTIEAGHQELFGSAALQYVQQRLGVGNGSDIGRMKRQQTFLAALAKKATDSSLLLDPLRLYRFLEEVTGLIKVDAPIAKLTKLAGLGKEFGQVGSENVHFLTMPIAPYAPDPNRLAIGPEAARLWELLKHDQPLTPELLEGSTTAAASG